MEKKSIVQVLAPAAGAAVVVVLIGVLVMMSDWNGTPEAGKLDKGDPSKAKVLPPPPDGYGTSGAVPGDQENDSGMIDALPSVDAPEWQAMDGGMKYWDVVEGAGSACPPGASVTIHYTGWRLDGFKFDSSRSGNRPVTFALANLIRGWQLGIPGMKPGGIRRLYIPSELAYGAPGAAGGKIPPNSPLVFEVKLLAFN